MAIFISGHRDITEVEFKKHYVPTLDMIIEKDYPVVVGDCPGLDTMAMNYLYEHNHRNTLVYYLGNEPMNNPGFNERNIWLGANIETFEPPQMIDSDTKRDFLMTYDSYQDLCWIREGKERSGTGMNLVRREWLSNLDRHISQVPLYYKWELYEANYYL
jgi:hypothetical protein